MQNNDSLDQSENSSIDSNRILGESKKIQSFKNYLKMQLYPKIRRNLLIILIIIISAVIRFIAAWYAGGFVHPDEVFQSLEMIHFRIYGQYGNGQTIPWEYDETHPYGGARSWFFVLILTVLYRFIMLFGVNDPLVLIFFARLFLSFLSMTTVIIAYLFGKEIFNKKVGLVSAFLCGIWWFFPFWAARTMTDSISADLLFLSIFLIYKTIKFENTKKRIIASTFSGIALGFAFMLRFPSGLMGFPLIITLIFQAIKESRIVPKDKLEIDRKKSIFIIFLPAIAFVLSSGFMILCQGLLDLFTWGDFLQSPINFFLYNVVAGMSSAHGIAPWYHYFYGFFNDFALYYLPFFLVFFVIGFGFKEKWKSKIWLWLIVLFWIVIFSFLEHKEFRFIFIVLPLCIIFVANGIIEFVSLIKHKHLKRIIFVTIITIFTASSLAISLYHRKWYWDFNSGICEAMYYVGKQDDVVRLVVFEIVWYTGGYAYLNKNISTYFVRINPLSPSTGYNSTFYRQLYTLNGTYCIVRSYENLYVRYILESLGMNITASIEGNPTAYVYS
jgi:phosphatidylinositol glycan class B